MSNKVFVDMSVRIPAQSKAARLKRVQAELIAAFAAPESEYQLITAESIIARAPRP